MLLLTVLGCYLPTAYGLRDDGILPPSGDTELTAHASQFGVTTVDGPSPLAGFQGRWRLGERVGLRTNFGAMIFPTIEDDPLPIWNVEGDVLVGLAQEPAQPVTVTLSGGMSLLTFVSPDSFYAFPALQTGVTVSRTVAGTVHPFVGVRINPILGAEAVVWTHLGAGVGWRPKLGERVTGSFGLEGGWDHGVSACLAPSEGLSNWMARDCDRLSVGLYGGVTLEGKRAAARREASRKVYAALPSAI